MTRGPASGESPAPLDDVPFFLNLLALLTITVLVSLLWLVAGRGLKQSYKSGYSISNMESGASPWL